MKFIKKAEVIEVWADDEQTCYGMIYFKNGMLVFSSKKEIAVEDMNVITGFMNDYSYLGMSDEIVMRKQNYVAS